MDIELVLDAHAIIAESPTWASAEQALYWVDIKASALYRFDPQSLESRSWSLPADIGAFALIAGDKAALVALRTGLFRLDLQSGTLSTLAASPFDPMVHRFNEGACDSQGRFWVGTMFDPIDKPAHPEPASLWSYMSKGGLRREPDASELHNGMAWSPNGRIFYLAHSRQRKVFAFSFDAIGGRLADRRPFIEIPAGLGIPDGAAVDEEGGYWCALHGASRLHRYRPDGTLDTEVILPVSQPTMCAFGGSNLEVMYVTSAADTLSPEQLRLEPHAGGIFRFKPRLRGITRHCLVV